MIKLIRIICIGIFISVISILVSKLIKKKIPPTTTIIGKDGAEMVLIPAGKFQMGRESLIPKIIGFKKIVSFLLSKISTDEADKPVHTVYLDAFYIDKYEVTNAQYKKFMDATGYKEPKYWNDSRFNAPNHPVVGVIWDDASAYCSWAGKRLPTEAEWEKSARGGLEGKKYVWGDKWPPPSGAGNFSESLTKDGYVWTSPVGSFKPNGYGLYDMAGNVWEWCADWFDSNYYFHSPKKNPTGPSSGTWRVLRGGLWSYNFVNILRVASRYDGYPAGRNDNVGFRCVQ